MVCFMLVAFILLELEMLHKDLCNIRYTDIYTCIHIYVHTRKYTYIHKHILTDSIFKFKS